MQISKIVCEILFQINKSLLMLFNIQNIFIQKKQHHQCFQFD